MRPHTVLVAMWCHPCHRVVMRPPPDQGYRHGCGRPGSYLSGDIPRSHQAQQHKEKNT